MRLPRWFWPRLAVLLAVLSVLAGAFAPPASAHGRLLRSARRRAA